jgi:hypothetical protein
MDDHPSVVIVLPVGQVAWNTQQDYVFPVMFAEDLRKR